MCHTHRKGEREGDVSVKINVDVHYVYSYRVEKSNHTLQHCYYCSPVPDKQTPIEYGMVEW